MAILVYKQTDNKSQINWINDETDTYWNIIATIFYFYYLFIYRVCLFVYYRNSMCSPGCSGTM